MVAKGFTICHISYMLPFMKSPCERLRNARSNTTYRNIKEKVLGVHHKGSESFYENASRFMKRHFFRMYIMFSDTINLLETHSNIMDYLDTWTRNRIRQSTLVFRVHVCK